MHMETDRLVIREFAMEDLQDLYEILGDEETMANCESAYSMEKTADFLRDFCISRKGALAAARKQSGKVIGYILFHEFESGVYELGWFFNRTYWKNGYAFEAGKAVTDYAFDSLHAHKIFAETVDGIKSVPLMEKLGMKREGLQRSQTRTPAGAWADLYLYGILPEDRR